MKLKYSITAVIIALITIGSWQVVKNSNLLTTSRSTESTSAAEPKLGAALRHSSKISFSRKEPLNFGALVAARSNRYIELSPDGIIHTSGPIVDQSNHTYIGDVNSRQFSGSRYQLQPGRLTFNVASSEQRSYIRVKFLPGELDSGINISKLKLRSGPDTKGVIIVKNHQRPSEMLFQIKEKHNGWRQRSTTDVVIDLIYGGRLTLGSQVTSEVKANMSVKVSVGSRSHFN